MLYAGVSWSAAGYEVEVIDDEGRPAAGARRFDARRTDEMIACLRGFEQPLVTVVESTCGILDGRMMAAGLEVYRADPPLLPPRPAFGSVPAAELARAARRDRRALGRLERARGTQTGREGELEAWIASSAAEDELLTSAGRCLTNGPRERPEIALTFDDGPQPPYTDRVLDVLERYGVRATFFCVGLNAAAHPEQLQRMREQGHAIANHTWSHPFLPELTRGELCEQIERTSHAIAESGAAVPTLFRPPYGSRTPEVMAWLAASDPTVVLWDVEAADWSMPGTDAIARAVLEQTRPGSIILLHDAGGDRSQTVGALPAIIEGLLERGFGFVHVDDFVPAARSSTYL